MAILTHGKHSIKGWRTVEAIFTRSEMIHAITQQECGIFIHRVSRGLGKAQRRAIREILWGMLLSQSVKLSHIGRWITDSTSRLLYRVKRMSRQLRSGDWKTEKIQGSHISGIAELIGEGTSIVIDSSDIRKDRGKAFEYLDRIRDGSTGEQAPGYSFVTVTAVFGKGRQMPLYMAPYSTKEPEYLSENVELKRAIETVVSGIGTKGIWVADREFDNRMIFNEFMRRRLQFLVCVYHDRTVSYEGSEQGLSEVGKKVKLNHRMEMTRRRHVGWRVAKRKLSIQYGAVEVILPEQWDEQRRERVTLKLWIIVVEGYDPSGKRTLFLTNIPKMGDDETLGQQ